MSLSKADVDALLATGYLEGLAEAPVSELRSRRDACLRAEVVVSYLRRVLQGELDLVRAETELRAEGARGDVGRLVEDLPAILAGQQQAQPGRLEADTPAHLAIGTLPGVQPGWDGPTDDELDEMIASALSSELIEESLPGGALPGGNLGHFSDEELGELARRLEANETELSDQRHQLHERIDELQAAIVERYKSGAASPDSLLA